MIPRIVFKPFAVGTSQGRLWFHDIETLNDELKLGMGSMIALALDQSQVEGKCDALGISPIGDVQNLRFGLFSTEIPSHNSYVACWYLGVVAAVPRTERSFTARLMMGAHELSDDEIGTLIVDVIRIFLGGAFETEDAGLPVRFTKLSYAFFDAHRDRKDSRTRALCDHIAASASRSEVKRTDRSLGASWTDYTIERL